MNEDKIAPKTNFGTFQDTPTLKLGMYLEKKCKILINPCYTFPWTLQCEPVESILVHGSIMLYYPLSNSG